MCATSTRDELFDLVKGKQKDLSDLLPQYINGFAIYSGITGALLKFALEQNATPEQRKTLIIFGAAFSFLGLLVCTFGAILRSAIIRDIKDLSTRLGLPETPSSYMPLKFTTIAAFAFIAFCLISWGYLFLT